MTKCFDQMECSRPIGACAKGCLDDIATPISAPAASQAAACGTVLHTTVESMDSAMALFRAAVAPDEETQPSQRVEEGEGALPPLPDPAAWPAYYVVDQMRAYAQARIDAHQDNIARLTRELEEAKAAIDASKGEAVLGAAQALIDDYTSLPVDAHLIELNASIGALYRAINAPQHPTPRSGEQEGAATCKADLPVASGKAARVMFPSMFRKMWSGGEVQRWLDENVNSPAPDTSADGQEGASHG